LNRINRRAKLNTPDSWNIRPAIHNADVAQILIIPVLQTIKQDPPLIVSRFPVDILRFHPRRVKRFHRLPCMTQPRKKSYRWTTFRECFPVLDHIPGQPVERFL
jgi:hypothetical protein